MGRLSHLNPVSEASVTAVATTSCWSLDELWLRPTQARGYESVNANVLDGLSVPVADRFYKSLQDLSSPRYLDGSILGS